MGFRQPRSQGLSSREDERPWERGWDFEFQVFCNIDIVVIVKSHCNLRSYILLTFVTRLWKSHLLETLLINRSYYYYYYYYFCCCCCCYCYIARPLQMKFAGFHLETKLHPATSGFENLPQNSRTKSDNLL